MSVLRFRFGVSQQVRKVRQALPVDLPRNRLHGEFFNKEDPSRDRRLWKLLGQGRRHMGSPLRRRGSDRRDHLLAQTEGAATKATSASFW